MFTVGLFSFSITYDAFLLATTIENLGCPKKSQNQDKTFR